MGFQNVYPERKPRLTAAMRKKCLQWARDHSDWTVEDWSKVSERYIPKATASEFVFFQVCFSDESYFECHDACQPKVWHKIGPPKPTMLTVKHPTKVMIWSVISANGVGRLQIVEGMMNSQKYINILQDHLLPQLNQWYPEGDAIFMQDRATCHTSKASMKFLEDNGVTVLQGLADFFGLWAR